MQAGPINISRTSSETELVLLPLSCRQRLLRGGPRGCPSYSAAAAAQASFMQTRAWKGWGGLWLRCRLAERRWLVCLWA